MRFYLFIFALFLATIGLYIRGFDGANFARNSNFYLEELEMYSKPANLVQNTIQNTYKAAHSSSIANLGDRLFVMYFAGDREGAKDVQIMGSYYLNGKFTNAKSYLNREKIAKDTNQYIRRVGNPSVLFADGVLHLFVSATSIGGWGTTKVFYYRAKITNPNDEIKFKFKEVLRLSPFANLSTLNRVTPTKIYKNGKYSGFVVPLYHELADKYGLLAVFDKDGNLQSTRRLNDGFKGQLQPAIAPLTRDSALMAFRNYGYYDRYMLISYLRLTPSGIIEEDSSFSDVINANNSINLINFNGDVLLIYNKENKIEGQTNSRGKLVLARFDRGKKTFKDLMIIKETSKRGGEISYPSSIVNGEFLDITYTLDRTQIGHTRLNYAYLQNLLVEARK